MKVPNSFVKVMCKLDGGKDELNAGEMRRVLKRIAYAGSKVARMDKKVSEACIEFVCYIADLSHEASRLLKNGLSPDQVRDKLLGKKAKVRK